MFLKRSRQVPLLDDSSLFLPVVRILIPVRQLSSLSLAEFVFFVPRILINLCIQGRVCLLSFFQFLSRLRDVDPCSRCMSLLVKLPICSRCLPSELGEHISRYNLDVIEIANCFRRLPRSMLRNQSVQEMDISLSLNDLIEVLLVAFGYPGIGVIVADSEGP